MWLLISSNPKAPLVLSDLGAHHTSSIADIPRVHIGAPSRDITLCTAFRPDLYPSKKGSPQFGSAIENGGMPREKSLIANGGTIIITKYSTV